MWSVTTCCFRIAAKCLEAAITSKYDGSQAFADELDFKLIASRIQQYPGIVKPGMLAFSRPEESMRSFYELATSPMTRSRLEEAAKTNQGYAGLARGAEGQPAAAVLGDRQVSGAGRRHDGE